MEYKTEKKCTKLKHFRTLFISDIHLGSEGCQAELLLDFLRYHSAEKVYLVGDIVDGWRLKKNWYWPQTHNDVVQKLLRLARKGADVFYLPGNHDEFLRDYLDTNLAALRSSIGLSMKPPMAGVFLSFMATSSISWSGMRSGLQPSVTGPMSLQSKSILI